MKVKALLQISVIGAILMIIVGCNADSESQSGQTEDGANEQVNDDKTVINFWHSMAGNNLEVMEELVEMYNESQNEVFVQHTYQGNYHEGLSKLNSVVGTDEIPDVMQLNEESLRPVIDGGFAKPMQEFIDRDNFDISNLEERVLGRYQVDGQLYSMPFNPSIAVMYYNKDAFEEVGLDPNNPPHTYSEIEEAAKKLTIESGGNTERYGINIRNFGWHYEQLRVNRGAYTVNNENGHADTATEAVLNSEEMVDIFTWIKGMYDEGIYANYGRNGDDVHDSFFNENVGMIIDSSSAAVPIIESAPFEVGMAEYPVPDGVEPHGSVIGGASLWIFDEIPEEKQEAAWDFVQYLTETETQIFWATNTGYFPINKDIFDTEEYKEYLEKYPEFQAAIDQLHRAEVNPITQGAFIGVYQDVRLAVEDQFERVLEGSVTIEEALDATNDIVTDALERYEKTEGAG